MLLPTRCHDRLLLAEQVETLVLLPVLVALQSVTISREYSHFFSVRFLPGKFGKVNIKCYILKYNDVNMFVLYSFGTIVSTSFFI